MRIFLPLLLMLSFLSWSCKGTQYASPAEYNKEKIIFGAGGGFTGKYETYSLLSNGQLFYKNSISEQESQVAGLSKKETKAILKKLKDMGFDDMNVEKNGNYNYFIEHNDGENSHKCSWADDKQDVPASLKELHKTLMAFTKMDK
ncbi:MAG: hypothetical protein MRZ79_04150 [Bacteroidia bacterium]|nr:hypothetical protein [Bacteroidia bacterium]